MLQTTTILILYPQGLKHRLHGYQTSGEAALTRHVADPAYGLTVCPQWEQLQSTGNIPQLNKCIKRFRVRRLTRYRLKMNT